MLACTRGTGAVKLAQSQCSTRGGLTTSINLSRRVSCHDVDPYLQNGLLNTSNSDLNCTWLPPDAACV